MRLGQRITCEITGNRRASYDGIVVELQPATLMDVNTGETYEAVKARIFDVNERRLVWLPAVKPTSKD